MLRTTLDKAWIKRPIKPLYSWTAATPKACFLDPNVAISVPVFPGMVFQRTSGENYTLIKDAAARPEGFGALYVGGDGIDEVAESGINAFAVWALDPDAEFEIGAEALDTEVTWTGKDTATSGADTLLHAWVAGDGQGKIVPVGSTKSDHTISTYPVARLLKINTGNGAITSIIVGGLRGTV